MSASSVVFLSHDESNWVPSNSHPVYFTLTVLLFVTFLPLPLISACETSLLLPLYPFMLMDGLPFFARVTFGRSDGMSVTSSPVALVRSFDLET